MRAKRPVPAADLMPSDPPSEPAAETPADPPAGSPEVGEDAAPVPPKPAHLISKVLERLADPEARKFWRRAAPELARGFRKGFRQVRFGPRTLLTGTGKYQLEPGSQVREEARIFVGEGATLRLAAGACIGIRAKINVACGVTIGAGTQMSWDVQVMDTDFHRILDEQGNPRPERSSITIGERVLLGASSIILKGVTIGDDSIVAAGSVVTKDVPSGTIVAGNPARPVSRTSGWT